MLMGKQKKQQQAFHWAVKLMDVSEGGWILEWMNERGCFQVLIQHRWPAEVCEAE